MHAPGTFFLAIVQYLIALFADGIVSGALDEPLVHELHFIVLRAEINKPVKSLNDGIKKGGHFTMRLTWSKNILNIVFGAVD
jgi:hypothetical protein